MFFQIRTDPVSLATHVSRFLLLTGFERWKKRIEQLLRDKQQSFYQQKVVDDYHWLETGLNEQMLVVQGTKQPLEQLNVRQLSALIFCAMVMEIHTRLSPRGQRALEGRLADAMQTDFSSLYLEMDVALRLLEEGYDIQLNDLEGAAGFDVQFSKGSIIGEVECKSLSPDAGRKIHRRDFYRVIHSVNVELANHVAGNGNDVLLVTVTHRMPSDLGNQRILQKGLVRMLRTTGLNSLSGGFFTIRRYDKAETLGSGLPNDEGQNLYDKCKKIFGSNCHVSGVMSEDGGAIVVMRSEREDDTSKPILEAMKEGAAQLSGKSPGFLAIQLEDLEPVELKLEHVRRRMGILSDALFRHYHADHVAGVQFSAYGAFEQVTGGFSRHTFTMTNERCLVRNPELPLIRGSQEFVAMKATTSKIIRI